MSMEPFSRTEWSDEGPSRGAVAHRSADDPYVEVESVLYHLRQELRAAIIAAENRSRPLENVEERLEPVEEEEESEWAEAPIDPPPDIDALNATASEFEIPWVWNEGMPPQLSAIFTATVDAESSEDSDMEFDDVTETSSTNTELAQDVTSIDAGSSVDRKIGAGSTSAVPSGDLASENSGSSLERAHKESYEWKFLQFAFRMITKTKNRKADPLPDIQEDSNPSTDRTSGEETEHINHDKAVEFDTRSFALRSRVSLNSSSTYYTAPSGIGAMERVQLNRLYV